MRLTSILFIMFTLAACQTVTTDTAPIPVITQFVFKNNHNRIYDYIKENEADIILNFEKGRLSVSDEIFNQRFVKAIEEKQSFLAVIKATSSIESYSERRLQFMTESLLRNRVAVIATDDRISDSRKGHIWFVPLADEPDWRATLDHLIIEPK